MLLADEVGLGKIIEAGMVLKEYAMRGMAERMLVLTPASLVGQWRKKLETKFGLAFATTYDPLLREDAGAFWDQPRIVVSIATARRQEHLEALARGQLDIVVVDEAHHLRDSASAGWKLVDALNKRFLLLLSATPVQNDLVELHNLLTLLKPGIFKTLKEFRAAYMTPGNPREPANPDSLRQLMRGAMIRNTRAIVALKLSRRHASTIRVEPSAGEAAVYAAVADAARSLATEGGGIGRQRLVLHHLLAAAGSSPAAAAKAAERIAERTGEKSWCTLAGRLAAIPCSATDTALVELLRKNPDEKKLVFVQARATLDHLTSRLKAEGISLARFDGSMSGPDKDAAIVAFANSASVLLCTQSGGEGRNIQFCNSVINFDVPWNPMAIEQRIGRIDRIGQEREVFVFNLVTAVSDEKREGLVWLGFNCTTGTVLDEDMLTAMRRTLDRAEGWQVPEQSVAQAAGPVWDAATIGARTGPLLERLVRADLDPFLVAMRRRLDRLSRRSEARGTDQAGRARASGRPGEVAPVLPEDDLREQ